MNLSELRKLSIEVEEVFNSFGLNFSQFQSDYQLKCLNGCGACCLNKDIFATPLEMLPLALYIFDHGRILEIQKKLKQNLLNSCIFYQKTNEIGDQGQCLVYQFRPSICRSFGAAAIYDKNNQKKLSVCKYIKEKNENTYQYLNQNLPESAPVISQFAQKIYILDPLLSSELVPINQALTIIIEKILLLDQIENSAN